MKCATSITLAEIERIAEEANSTEPNINGACRSFCARLIGLLRMPQVLETDAERAA